MLSHIVEYSCQYSDQVRKKQKVWHDGKLKHFQINNRFILYTEDGIVLSSSFVTNRKEVAEYISEENFDIVEHNIFGRFVVVISEIIAEYDREIQHIKTTTNMNPNNTHTDNHEQFSGNQTTTPILHQQHPDKMILKSSTESLRTQQTTRPSVGVKMSSIVSGNVNTSSLALKFNKPFKPPRMINNLSNCNRPNFRNAQVKQETTSMYNNNAISTDLASNTPCKKQEQPQSLFVKDEDVNETITSPNQNVKRETDESIYLENVVKPKNTQVLSNKPIIKQQSTYKIRRIVHEPIILP